MVGALLLQKLPPLLKQFPTSGPRILVEPGENAGVVDLGHGQRLVFKIESHNHHPSAIEPFQGAATGVGGNPFFEIRLSSAIEASRRKIL